MTDHTPEHEEAPVDEAVSGPPADEGNPASVDPSVDATEEIDPETFPKAYLVKLRDEAAKCRQRAAVRDTVTPWPSVCTALSWPIQAVSQAPATSPSTTST